MRVKTGITRRRRHHKVLKRTRGMRMTKHRLYKVAKEADLHAGQYAYVGRRLRKRDQRRLWIQRIQAGLSLKKDGYSYAAFIHDLVVAKIVLNRKMLADLVVRDAETFQAIVAKARSSSKE
ncbi:MAG: 50S ribosomal protein L20 [Candidatus Chisholmbacteria bacterium RIFCSPLOWO2_01_FULL_50_28]|uniref:Large ribosomal subunit protein bL20 n=1 Tax=Candidatus Chisholmbacteria bacterium RIFCSPHIGHO2_01_FULL_52_32 TaxID=1797591 RepID=A0A1G1VSP2_9BACT|nr:MAG: 50S ribosomal protein L20 [Candidatus Chisholmbacteria bacterium RIFCSPHIGHO2_01_FULL_52_32]OGY20285.1 MAG: 50S ribosomal protein L20 [Candidatus Chisholmbacteria bacterium RIFCSPLOWO2_01_FULL_50_28]